MTISKRDLLATLSKPELLDIGRWVEVEVTGKMSKEDLLDRLAPSERADLSKILPRLAYEALKASCKDLGLPVDGREKSVFVARLLAAATPIGKPVPQAAPPRAGRLHAGAGGGAQEAPSRLAGDGSQGGRGQRADAGGGDRPARSRSGSWGLAAQDGHTGGGGEGVTGAPAQLVALDQ